MFIIRQPSCQVTPATRDDLTSMISTLGLMSKFHHYYIAVLFDLCGEERLLWSPRRNHAPWQQRAFEVVNIKTNSLNSILFITNRHEFKHMQSAEIKLSETNFVTLPYWEFCRHIWNYSEE